MSLRTVGELKDEIAGVLTGVDLDTVIDLNGALQRAARTLATQVYIPETTGKANINLYDGVYSYSADSRIFGSTIVDFRPQGERDSSDNVFRDSVKEFDRKKESLVNGVRVAFEYLFGSPILRADGFTAKTKVVIDEMSSATGWTAAGSASGLVADETVYYNSPASLRLTLTGSSVGTLTKTLSTSLDLTAYEDVGVAFLALRLPDGSTSTNLTSVALRLGSSDSAYDLVSDTDGFLGAWTAGNWLLVALDFATASGGSGTPDWSAIDYVQVRLTHTGTFTNVRVGGLFISLPSAYEMLYKSCAIFNDSGTVSNEITDDNDEILLSDAAYNLYVYESALTIAMQKGGSSASGMVAMLKETLHGNGKDQGLYALYRSMEPDDTVPFQTSYARLPRIRK